MGNEGLRRAGWKKRIVSQAEGVGIGTAWRFSNGFVDGRETSMLLRINVLSVGSRKVLPNPYVCTAQHYPFSILFISPPHIHIVENVAFV